MTTETALPMVKCVKCEHEWVLRRPVRLGTRCPNCLTRNWNGNNAERREEAAKPAS